MIRANRPMQVVARRSLLVGFANCLAGLAFPGQAAATLVRGLTLEALVQRSDRILVLTTLDSTCRYIDLGGQRQIVTDHRVRVDEVVAKAAPPAQELLVRTLGGRVGSVGELVHGQPELALGAPALGFLKLGADGNHWFMGMAQGHYPIIDAGTVDARLAASSNLPTIRDWEGSAVRRLRGARLTAVRALLNRAVVR